MGYFDYYPYARGQLIAPLVITAGAAITLIFLGLVHTERRLRCEWHYTRARTAEDTARVDAIVLSVAISADTEHRKAVETCREFRTPAPPR